MKKKRSIASLWRAKRLWTAGVSAPKGIVSLLSAAPCAFQARKSLRAAAKSASWAEFTPFAPEMSSEPPVAAMAASTYSFRAASSPAAAGTRTPSPLRGLPRSSAIAARTSARRTSGASLRPACSFT